MGTYRIRSGDTLSGIAARHKTTVAALARDGRSSFSDFIERNTLGAGGRSGLKIFAPL
ncbi:MAG: LysM peptidoglycan-binding domain-containing protein [Myxococcaceae bacterium]|jgi:LysM repeat protein|nr:LysM peptidoglycan-binding domain-containing protein [Myxococcaceae bacterium]